MRVIVKGCEVSVETARGRRQEAWERGPGAYRASRSGHREMTAATAGRGEGDD